MIRNADYVFTGDDSNRLLPNTDILVEGPRISAIGKNLKADHAQELSGEGKLVMPGFVNLHHHMFQTLQRAIPLVQDAPLFDWLIHLYEIWRELTPEAVYVSSLVGLGELLLTGCTTTTDHFYVFPRGAGSALLDEQIKAARLLGIRFHPTRGSMSRGQSNGGLPPDDVVQTEEEILDDSRRLVETYHDPGPFSMLRIALAPCSPFSVSEKLLKETIALARRHGLRCHTHLAETLDEERYCLQTYGKRPLAFMKDMGWLGEDVWFAHAIYLNDEEIRIMAQTGTGAAHCPSSNLRLGSGIAPVPAMLASGVPVGIGVDGSASNDSSDMLSELRMAMLVHRIRASVDSMPAGEVVKMATRGGARILGYPEIGSLEVGKAADLIMIGMQKIGYAGGLHDPVAALLFCGDSHIVDTSIVNGRIVVEDGKLLSVNEKDLVAHANRISGEMLEKASRKTGLNYLSRGSKANSKLQGLGENVSVTPRLCGGT